MVSPRRTLRIENIRRNNSKQVDGFYISVLAFVFMGQLNIKRSQGRKGDSKTYRKKIKELLLNIAHGER